MPIIDHNEQRMSEVADKRSERDMISAEHGAESLSVTEMIIEPGYVGGTHTHDTDQAVMVTEGSIQFTVGDETQTVRSGYSMFAPPGVTHRVVNNTWVAARLLVISPTNEPTGNYLE